MISGSVHLWHWLELLLTLDRVGYEGWIGADILAKFSDAQTFYSVNSRMIDAMLDLIEHLGPTRLRNLISDQSGVPQIYEIMANLLSSFKEVPGDSSTR